MLMGCQTLKQEEHSVAFLKRITTSLSARVDRLVGELENHDAVVEAGIRERRRAYARASVRLMRLRQHGERLRSRIAELDAASSAWRDRAVNSAQEDTALECLRRHKQAGEQAQSLKATLRHHVETETQLAREVESLRQRLLTLEHRRHMLRSREATAEAAAQVRVAAAGVEPDLDETFERWEMHVVEAELDGDSTPQRDPFESAFVADEERAGLSAELAALKARAQQAPGQAGGGCDEH